MEEQKQSSSFAARSFPLTPDSPMHPTLLPHVKESIELIAPVTPPSPVTSNTKDAGLSLSSQDFKAARHSAALLNGLHVLAAERDALNHLHHVYATSTPAQEGFSTAVSMIAATVRKGGKLVVSGVGKSGKIGQKFVATCNSLQILSAWLHPTEALHGDLGIISPSDTVLLLSYSSHSTELHHLLSHISSSPLIAVTGHADAATNPLFTLFPRTAPSVVLPAPVPTPEKELFGVAAPTTSTTAALAICDAVALAVGQELHTDMGRVFGRCHPGGAIGKGHAEQEQRDGEMAKRKEETERMEMG